MSQCGLAESGNLVKEGESKVDRSMTLERFWNEILGYRRDRVRYAKRSISDSELMNLTEEEISEIEELSNQQRKQDEINRLLDRLPPDMGYRVDG